MQTKEKKKKKARNQLEGFDWVRDFMFAMRWQEPAWHKRLDSRLHVPYAMTKLDSRVRVSARRILSIMKLNSRFQHQFERKLYRKLKSVAREGQSKAQFNLKSEFWIF